MSTDWKGVIRKSSPVDPRPGVAHYAQNTRLSVTGELRRRRGFARSNLAKQVGAILAIIPANPPSGIFVGINVTSTVEGLGGPAGLWTDPTLAAPTGTASQGYTLVDTLLMNEGPFASNAISKTMVSTVGFSAGAIVRAIVNITCTHTAFSFSSQGGYTYGVLPAYAAPADFDWTDIPAAPGADGGQTKSITGTAALDWVSPMSLSTTMDWTLGAAIGAGGFQFYVNLSGAGDGFAMALTISGSVALYTGSAAYTITINRTDDYTTSYDVYAQLTAYPADPLLATSVGNVTIAPSATFCTTSWTPPSSGTWKFVAVPRFGAISGPMGRLT